MCGTQVSLRACSTIFLCRSKLSDGTKVKYSWDLAKEEVKVAGGCPTTALLLLFLCSWDLVKEEVKVAGERSSGTQLPCSAEAQLGFWLRREVKMSGEPLLMRHDLSIS